MIHWNRVQIAKEEIASKSHDFSRVKPFKISEKKGEKISPKNKTQGKKERLENFLRVSVLWSLIHSGLIRSPKSLAQYFCKGSRSWYWSCISAFSSKIIRHIMSMIKTYIIKIQSRNLIHDFKSAYNRDDYRLLAMIPNNKLKSTIASIKIQKRRSYEASIGLRGPRINSGHLILTKNN